MQELNKQEVMEVSGGALLPDVFNLLGAITGALQDFLIGKPK